MKIQFLGTCAAEGVPAFWCNCENCKRSREIGGRAIRSRSQALIDGKLLIDFPADTYWHLMKNGIDLLDIENCLVTHTHSDHLYERDIHNIRPGFAHTHDGYRFNIYGSAAVCERVDGQIAMAPDKFGSLTVNKLDIFTPTEIGGYTVTALPSRHDPKSGPQFYMVKGEKTLLYAHDTHYFTDNVWEYLEKTKPHFDLVSLDCTNACLPLTYIGHMGLTENAEVRRRMIDMGVADENTVFVCNHFSHNGTNVVYDDFVPIAAKEGFLVSYDGMTVTF